VQNLWVRKVTALSVFAVAILTAISTAQPTIDTTRIRLFQWRLTYTTPPQMQHITGTTMIRRRNGDLALTGSITNSYGITRWYGETSIGVANPAPSVGHSSTCPFYSYSQYPVETNDSVMFMLVYQDAGACPFSYADRKTTMLSRTGKAWDGSQSNQTVVRDAYWAEGQPYPRGMVLDDTLMAVAVSSVWDSACFVWFDSLKAPFFSVKQWQVTKWGQVAAIARLSSGVLAYTGDQNNRSVYGKVTKGVGVSNLADFGTQRVFWANELLVRGGTVLAAGAGEIDPGFYRSARLKCLTESGSVVWAREFAIPHASTEFMGVDTAAEGGYIGVATISSDSDGATPVAWLLRFDAQGDTLWSRIYGNNLTQYTAVDVVTLTHGEYALASTIMRTDKSDSSSILVLKVAERSTHIAYDPRKAGRRGMAAPGLGGGAIDPSAMLFSITGRRIAGGASATAAAGCYVVAARGRMNTSARQAVLARGRG